MRLRSSLLPLPLLAALALAAPAAAAPANDALGNAEVLSGPSDSAVATTTTATYENGEPYLYGGHHSVWFRWTAPSNGAVTVDTAGAGFDTALGVYTGSSVTALTEVQNSDDADYGTHGASRVRWTATAGVTYKIMLNGSFDETGATPVHLSLDTSPNAPANDAFANATSLGTGTLTDAAFDTALSSAQAGEPAHVPGGARHSVWFRWTPASTGGVAISACGDRYRNRAVAVYTGASVGGLTPVASGDNYAFDGQLDSCPEAIFVAQAGVTYRIAVDARGPQWGPGLVKLFQRTTPPETSLSPPAATTGPSVTLTSSASAGTTRQCRLDQGAWTPCGSSHELSGLTTGQHTFTVRAVDSYGWADPTPASRTWTVDATGPVVTFTSGPAASIPYTDHPALTFTADETATFRCKYEGMNDFVACTSPWTLYGTKPGQHLVQVRATDAYGNVGAAATYAFASFDPHANARGPVGGPTTPRTPASGAGGKTGAGAGAGTTTAKAVHATLGYTTTTRARVLARHTIRLTVGCSPACTGTLRLALGKRILATVRLTKPATSHTRNATLNRAARKYLKNYKGKRIVLRLSGAFHSVGIATSATPSTGLQLR